ncbi:RNA polymerase sigma factor [Microaceticoccus formicicus]|uniref:RNA polymerase sigma factor n=1 Tax=Microaceticoccus formicicus TaxID=3118105 RepID=UPI003CCFFE02|nr:sigma-70 family RNA polymerase sigma factor [Peptoniphilaceae bacterium AMB_02]
MHDWEEIYQKNFKDVYYFILKLSKNETIAEDICSDTFLQAMKSIESFKGETSLRVWLCSIAKNKYFSYLRKNNPQDIDIDLNLLPTDQDLEEEVLSALGYSEIYNKILSLPKPYSEVVKLRLIDELSFKKIGNYFKKTDNWACVTFHRGKRMLKKFMEEENEKL